MATRLKRRWSCALCLKRRYRGHSLPYGRPQLQYNPILKSRVVDPTVRNIKETGSLKVGKDRFWLLHVTRTQQTALTQVPLLHSLGRVFIIDCWLSKPRSSFDRCKCFGHAVELCRVGGSTVGTLYWVGTKRNKLRIWLKGFLNPFVLATALFDLCRKQGESRMLSGNINIYR